MASQMLRSKITAKIQKNLRAKIPLDMTAELLPTDYLFPGYLAIGIYYQYRQNTK